MAKFNVLPLGLVFFLFLRLEAQAAHDHLARANLLINQTQGQQAENPRGYYEHFMGILGHLEAERSLAGFADDQAAAVRDLQGLLTTLKRDPQADVSADIAKATTDIRAALAQSRAPTSSTAGPPPPSAASRARMAALQQSLQAMSSGPLDRQADALLQAAESILFEPEVLSYTPTLGTAAMNLQGASDQIRKNQNGASEGLSKALASIAASLNGDSSSSLASSPPPSAEPSPPPGPADSNPFGSTDKPATTVTTFVTPAPPPTAASPSPTDNVQLTPAQLQAVVLIKGDNAMGTGFLAKTKDGPCVITNIHVISNNPNIKITTSGGKVVVTTGLKGASDRDLAMFSITENGFSYLDLADDASQAASIGDGDLTPGNSEGGDVVLSTPGKILGIGPQKIEFDNPIYHGNSGGPVFDVKSGKVVAVVTEGMKVELADDLDKASFASRQSAISHSMRYFGMRIDNVPTWEPYQMSRLQVETSFLDRFHDRSRALDSLLSAPSAEDLGKMHDPKEIAEATYYMNDSAIESALTDFSNQITGADTSQQISALRQLSSELTGLAATDMPSIQHLDNFYTFDQQRAQEETAYRKAIVKALDGLGDNVSRLAYLPRSNR